MMMMMMMLSLSDKFEVIEILSYNKSNFITFSAVF